MDDAWVDLSDNVVAEAQPLDAARPQVLDEHVRVRQQPAKQGFAIGVAQVERHARLVGVQQQEVVRVKAGVIGRSSPALFAAAGRLDLDDIGAEPRQRFCAGRACLELLRSTMRTPLRAAFSMLIPPYSCPSGGLSSTVFRTD